MLAERVKIRHSDKQSEQFNYMKPLTTHDMENSEKAILTFSQQTSFAEEIDLLVNGRSHVKQSSSIRKLNPILDDGLLRVGGRLSRAALPFELKHPVILQKNWLNHAPSAICKIIAKCVVCRRQHARVGEQKMSDLPSERLTADEPPFTNIL
jgi:hypothetical protein